MSDLNWASPEEEQKALEGIAAVRNDSNNINWTYITYAGLKGPSSQKFVFGGSGEGTADELKANFTSDNICFALLRVTDKVDLSVTVKFVWINWVATSAPRMMKSRLSVQLGAIQSFFQPYSSDLTANSEDEISHNLVMEKVMAYSMSGSKVIDESTGQAGYRAAAGTAETVAVKPIGGRMADGPVQFADDAQSHIADLRDDSTETNWILFGYEDGNKPFISLLAKGNGPVEEMAAQLNPGNVGYGVVRVMEQIDDSETVKFCYIRWIGDKVPVMQRAKLGTHAGDISGFLNPVHATLDAPDHDEINSSNISKIISKGSGTANNVLDDNDARAVHTKPVAHSPPPKSAGDSPAPAAAAAPKKAAPSGKTGHGGTVQTLEDAVNIADGIREAIQSVRDDSNLIDWVAVTYDFSSGKNQSKSLVLKGSGEGGLGELKSNLAADQVVYALYRSTEKIDDSETVKFTFIDWHGEKIHRMQRAILGTHQGAVRELFEPYHVDILDATDQDEVTEEVITAKIQKAAGTANYVL